MSDNNAIQDKSYLFLSTMLSARETNLLTRDKMERMLSAGSYGEAVKILVECGYEDMSGMKASELENALARHRAAIFEEISHIVPEPEIVDVFRLRYDYHNAKALIKAEGAGTQGDYLFSDSGRVSTAVLKNAYISEDYRFLPLPLGHAMADAAGVLARTGNPQLADFTLDRAYFEEFLALAGSVQSTPFLKDYAKLLIDSANLRSGVRSLRMGRGIEFLRTALIPGGTVSEERIALASGAADSMAALFNASPLEAAAQLGAQAVSGGTLTEFELACDDAVTRFLGKAKLGSFGAEKVIAYLAALENEITAARMILTGRLSGVSPEVIRERLRESYA